MPMFEVYDDTGYLQLSDNATTVHMAEKRMVTGTFLKSRQSAGIAIRPQLDKTITIYPTLSSDEDTHNYMVTGAEDGMEVFEFANSAISSSPDTFGLALYSEAGDMTYHSSVRPLKVRGAFRSSPYNLEHFETRTNDNSFKIAKSVFLDTIPFPPGCYPSNTALFISSVGAEGGVAETVFMTASPGPQPLPLVYYYVVRPMVRIEANGIRLGYSGEMQRRVARTDDRERYRFDGGGGHIQGFFVDIANY